MTIRLCLLVLVALVTCSTPVWAGQSAPQWVIDTKASRLVVHVYASGALSGLAHDHHFVPQQWSGSTQFDPAHPQQLNVTVTVDANSLRDQQPELSPEDRQKVERQVASPKVLDAGRYPTIRFRATRLQIESQAEGTLRGSLTGTLELHGHRAPIEVQVATRWAGEGLNVNGSTAFDQTAFGIEPYSTALGTIGVQDRVVVELQLRAWRRG